MVLLFILVTSLRFTSSRRNNTAPEHPNTRSFTFRVEVPNTKFCKLDPGRVSGQTRSNVADRIHISFVVENNVKNNKKQSVLAMFLLRTKNVVSPCERGIVEIQPILTDHVSYSSKCCKI
mmetsp:Transcript_2212/g.8252  ORF Transcript_2212/g.8252 Transcript_2212/m.8252 type:complete len:120 (-) Transcript_2212:95-454(-)